MKIKSKGKPITNRLSTAKKSNLRTKKKKSGVFRPQTNIKVKNFESESDSAAEEAISEMREKYVKKKATYTKNASPKGFARPRFSNNEDISDSDDAVADGAEAEHTSDTDNEEFMSNEIALKKMGELPPELDMSDSELSDDEADDVHKPPDELEVASDETDDETVPEPPGLVTLKMVEEWREKLKTDKTSSTISCVVKAFHGALNRVAAEEDKTAPSLRVVGSSVFNAVVQLCVLELQPAIKSFLQLPPGKRIPPHKCKKWVKIKTTLRCYLADLLKFLSAVTSEHILSVLLKHLHQMIPFVTNFSNVTKGLVKKLVELWSCGEETIRVLAFMCLLRLTTSEQKSLLDKVLKMMYMAFIKNSKFVSPNTLPAVNFMRRSLTELYNLDENISYYHVFLYIRQLAIHLRNAITVQKKENRQAVCNWQFMQSIHLWTDLLGASVNKPQLQQLVYPLVQVSIGTIKLVPSAQYFPLRFHCLEMLIELSANSGVFIPVLPFLLEVLTNFDFNKKHKKVSMKPLDFTCILRVSKGQLQENGFKDAVIENIYKLLLQYMANESHSIAFPDMTVPAVIQIKMFLKNCKNPNYCKKMKQILEKIEENAHYIEEERKKVSFALSDKKAISAWENGIKLQSTPLAKFYTSWNKMNIQQIAKKATDNVKLGDYNIPVIKKPVKSTAADDDGPVELFPSDESDADEFFGAEAQSKKKRGKRGSKKQQNPEPETKIKSEMKIKPEEGEEVEDIVEDFEFSESE
ncbi:nucleolar complex protein 2 homolog isoform X4 [Schistocerca gregaria]|uniref:nucleolar complex protein 2 homolog isoform X1 n=1 Tax=Schistocerca gregaria TaxID=7010 RepID=UPI00211E2F3F|nr:nucleolar complex protein 2 homolog isoform X1 [Schistocerca gregaria]XP_049858119.1 nucleolar complex protein 2 homolog isoform X2 [Schistocerca gregaria]XP_049858120.1 nucleolar complex protein 2 homolog isoform X3 [Schistocerca gregaria]XP_049858121.1 nucleolar complex protein 2 homolog isoform X4 [Schistocerca gregaria]